MLAFLSPACRPCRELVPDLNRLARDQRDTPVVVVAMDGTGADYASELSKRVVVVGDAEKEIQEAYAVGRTPLVYLLDEDRTVVNRTVSNSLIDLEDTLDGLGRPQGNATWVPEAGTVGSSPDGEAEKRAEVGPR